jgi:hypothetical protein
LSLLDWLLGLFLSAPRLVQIPRAPTSDPNLHGYKGKGEMQDDEYVPFHAIIQEVVMIWSMTKRQEPKADLDRKKD